jgi:GNAT superfamily N-acetyltransferase
VFRGDVSYHIRKAASQDARDILECLKAAFAPFQSSYTAEAYLDTVLTEAALKDRMSAMSVLVAVDGEGSVIGTLAFGDLGNGEGHLRGMAVIPVWQGRGVADKLLETACAQLEALGCTVITLDTTAPLARARRFYERQGFHPTVKTKDFFGMLLTEHAKVLSGAEREQKLR